MAKIGEGDPRWIVTDRQDGKNVNDWHWNEKDVTPSAKKFLEKLIEEVNLPSDDNKHIEITNIKNISGEATIINRKKKKGLIYELSTTITWKGNCFGHSLSGKVSLSEIADDISSSEDIEVRFIVDNSPLTKEQQKELKNDFTEIFRALVVDFQVKFSDSFNIAIPKQIKDNYNNTSQKPLNQPLPYKKVGSLILICGIVVGISYWYLNIYNKTNK